MTHNLLSKRGDDPTGYPHLSVFERTRQRELAMELDLHTLGPTALITGGTGCIGTALLRMLTEAGVDCVSYSRHTPPKANWLPGVRYEYGDVRDRERFSELAHEVNPNSMFHLAAQRDPGLAEREVANTLATNVLGSEIVIGVATSLEVPRVAVASTGKALRFFTSDVYAASKQATERVAAHHAAGSSTALGIGRFTHVVDNSIIFGRLVEWATKDLPIKLHGADVYFYIQSAIESAQLLAHAALSAVSGGASLCAIRDLGVPMSLSGLAIDVRDRFESSSTIRHVGFEDGYEESAHPLTYDPLTAGDVTPLFNAIEAASSESPTNCPVDRTLIRPEKLARFNVAIRTLEAGLRALDGVPDLRAQVGELSIERLGHLLGTAPRPVLDRMLNRPHHYAATSRDHALVDEILSSLRIDGSRREVSTAA